MVMLSGNPIYSRLRLFLFFGQCSHLRVNFRK